MLLRLLWLAVILLGYGLHTAPLWADHGLALRPPLSRLFINGREIKIQGWSSLHAFKAPQLYLPRGRHLYRFRSQGSWQVINISQQWRAYYQQQEAVLATRNANLSPSLIAALTQALGHPDDPLLLHWVGNIFARQGNYQAAVRSYQAALAINPCLAITQLNLAWLYQRQGRRILAQRHLALAQAFNVLDVFGIKPGIARLQALLGRGSSARLVWSDYIVLHPETRDQLDLRWATFTRTCWKYLPAVWERAKLISNWGRYYEQRRKYQRALTCYHRALKLLLAVTDRSRRMAVARVIFNNIARTCSLLGWPESRQYCLMAQQAGE